MLSKAKTLKGYALSGLDGDIGSVEEFFFDDRHWTIRYLVAETGSWLSEREVLISPRALSFVNHENKNLSVNLTMRRIEDSPRLESHKPVSRQFEISYHSYFGWPIYWDGPYAWGAFPYLLMQAGRKALAALLPEAESDPDLRSTRDTTGLVVMGADGAIGRVEDVILDDTSWTIRYLIIDTGSWWPGKKVLVSPAWLERVDWGKPEMFIKLPRATIKAAPEYVEAPLVSREYETLLHSHYEHPGYWLDDHDGKKPAI